jgi:peroxiredoxin
MNQDESRGYLNVGQKALGFIAKTYLGEVISFENFLGKLVWLIFYRYPGCPLCNLHLKAVRKRIKILRSRGLEIVCVFETSEDKFKSLKDPHPAITMISDPDRVLYRLYGTEVKMSGLFRPTVAFNFFKAIVSGFGQGRIDGSLGQLPASFLIAEDGLIEQIYYGKTIVDHIPFAAVERFIQSRTQGIWMGNFS